jgi:2-oxoglutarate dehydrogenase E1 component
MSRQQANQAFLNTAFLYGANAPYIEDLYARYQENPASVDAEWQEFFAGFNDPPADAVKIARGASWTRSPLAAVNGTPAAAETNARGAERGLSEKIQAKAQAGGLSLLPEDVQRATRDSVRALMLIRSYRMRGHLAADLDPLKLEPRGDQPELDPESYGFTDADLDRKIFLDHVLGMEFATMREILTILKRTYCSTLGVEFMHISSPAEKAWIQERIEGPEKGVAFTVEGKRAILNKLIESEGF